MPRGLNAGPARAQGPDQTRIHSDRLGGGRRPVAGGARPRGWGRGVRAPRSLARDVLAEASLASLAGPPGSGSGWRPGETGAYLLRPTGNG